jgi:hypothetical protein
MSTAYVMVVYVYTLALAYLVCCTMTLANICLSDWTLALSAKFRSHLYLLEIRESFSEL